MIGDSNHHSFQTRHAEKHLKTKICCTMRWLGSKSRRFHFLSTKNRNLSRHSAQARWNWTVKDSKKTRWCLGVWVLWLLFFFPVLNWPVLVSLCRYTYSPLWTILNMWLSVLLSVIIQISNILEICICFSLTYSIPWIKSLPLELRFPNISQL